MIRTAAVACVLAAMLLWVGPSAAFNSAAFSRSVGASVVSDASAYNAPYMPTCTRGPFSSTCTFYVYNNGTATQTFTVTKQVDSGPYVSSYNVDSTGTHTGTAKTVGQRSTVVATMASCTLCGTKLIEWMIVGQDAGVLDWREEHVVLTVVYT